jgi:hypothetical protein
MKVNHQDGSESTSGIQIITSQIGVIPLHSGRLIILAEKHIIGKKGETTKEPLPSLLVGVYNKADSCVANIGNSWQKYPDIVAQCEPDYSGETNDDGLLDFRYVAVGKYLVIGGDGTDKHLGSSVEIKDGKTVRKSFKQKDK